MAENEVIVRPEQLENFLTDLFERAGMTRDDAAYSAHALVLTNLWGIDSHGVLRAAIYLERLSKRVVNPRPNIQTIRGGFALEVLDGDDGLGYIVGRAAMNRAIELAEKFNIAAVGAIKSNHFGAAALYARLAAERGMIGIAMTNVVPNVVAPGGKKPITGNNPLAIAIPTYGDFPFVLDMSMSAVAGGKLLLAAKKGQKIPLDWATDKEGRPTDDPTAGFAGFLLPMGGYKGLGLSYVVDILSGLITGGVFGDQMKGMYTHPNDPSLTGHFMIAINAAAIIGKDEMQSRMNAFYQRIKTSPMWDEQGEMFLPGEIEYRSAIKRQREGIPLPQKLFDELVALGNKMGASSTLTQM
jgi:LDH2 family malate/lactate/ureidoglycolate dehydrogenase